MAKSINGLMKHLRTVHKINIDGSAQKRKLRNIGYYHGYKGYRFHHAPGNRIPYTDFQEILAMNEFDMTLKSLFYPKIMFIETALKNYALEIVLEKSKTESFNDIFSNVLTKHKDLVLGSEQYQKSIKKRLDLRNHIYQALSRYYQSKLVIQHFYHKDRNVPIWAIFEVISLGEFGNFIACLNKDTKLDISKSLGLNKGFDTNGTLTELIIYTVKDLRNAVAHNDMIFDTRFKNAKVNQTIIKCLENDTKISNIDFNTIVDYLILICYLLKKMATPKAEIRKMVSQFVNTTELLRKRIPIGIYSKIVYTNTREKLKRLERYI